MNFELKWSIQDYIKDYILYRVKNGAKRNEILIEDCTNEAFEAIGIPEIKEAIIFLSNDEYNR